MYGNNINFFFRLIDFVYNTILPLDYFPNCVFRIFGNNTAQ